MVPENMQSSVLYGRIFDKNTVLFQKRIGSYLFERSVEWYVYAIRGKEGKISREVLEELCEAAIGTMGKYGKKTAIAKPQKLIFVQN